MISSFEIFLANTESFFQFTLYVINKSLRNLKIFLEKGFRF